MTLLFLFQSSAAVQPSLLPRSCCQLPSLSLRLHSVLPPAPLKWGSGQHIRLCSHVGVCLLLLAYCSAVLLQMDLTPFSLRDVPFVFPHILLPVSPFVHPHKPPPGSSCSHPFLNMPKLRWHLPPLGVDVLAGSSSVRVQFMASAATKTGSGLHAQYTCMEFSKSELLSSAPVPIPFDLSYFKRTCPCRNRTRQIPAHCITGSSASWS